MATNVEEVVLSSSDEEDAPGSDKCKQHSLVSSIQRYKGRMSVDSSVGFVLLVTLVLLVTFRICLGWSYVLQFKEKYMK